MSALPPEMIYDLLCRLPVKSLLRFRCISKGFCSTIDGPDFTKLHLQRSAQTHSHQSLIVTRTLLYSIDLHSLDRAVKIKHPLKKRKCKSTVIGSCNGLLCLFDSETEFVLWNVSTRKHHLVPYTAIIFPNEVSVESNQVAYGFGYDSVHDDYKLVRIVRFRDAPDSEVMIYGLRSNSWKKGEGFPYHFLSPRPKCVFSDGALHWLAIRAGTKEGYIASFDLAAEKFGKVGPTPECIGKGLPVRMGMGLWEGRFCGVLTCTGKQTDIWVMRHHGMEDSWAKVLSTSLPQVTGSSTGMVPMAVFSSGNEVLLLKDYEEFILYDPKSNTVKNAMIRDLPNCFDAALYVESLVKPFPVVNVVGETAGKGKSDGGKKNAKKRDGFLSSGFKLVL